MTVRERELATLPPGTDPPRGRLAGLLRFLIGPFRRGPAPAARPATGFYTDTTVCIGCKACEVACKQWNQLPADGFTWTGNSYDNTGELSASSWRHVKFIEQFTQYAESSTAGALAAEPAGRQSLDVLPSGTGNSIGRWLMMSDVCKHCVAAPCQQACPTGALLHNEFDNVYIQPDICNGCAYCIASCPFGVITRSPMDGHAHKCTLCYDRQRDGLMPACAKACPTQSIQFGPIEELRERARNRVTELHQRGTKEAYLYGDQPGATYSELHSFYLLLDRPSVYGLPDRPFNPWLHMKGDYIRSIVTALAALFILLVVFAVVGR